MPAAPDEAEASGAESSLFGSLKKVNLLLVSPADYIFGWLILISGIALAWKLD